MGTQKEIAEKIIDRGANYILQVKGNQKSLMVDIALYFEKDVFPCEKKDLAGAGRHYKEVYFDPGKQEARECYVENDVGWLKGRHPKWKRLSEIGACVSTVTEKGETTRAVSYSIYSRQGMGQRNTEKEGSLKKWKLSQETSRRLTRLP